MYKYTFSSKMVEKWLKMVEIYIKKAIYSSEISKTKKMSYKDIFWIKMRWFYFQNNNKTCFTVVEMSSFVSILLVLCIKNLIHSADSYMKIVYLQTLNFPYTNIHSYTNIHIHIHIRICVSYDCSCARRENLAIKPTPFHLRLTSCFLAAALSASSSSKNMFMDTKFTSKVLANW